MLKSPKTEQNAAFNFAFVRNQQTCDKMAPQRRRIPICCRKQLWPRRLVRSAPYKWLALIALITGLTLSMELPQTALQESVPSG